MEGLSEFLEAVRQQGLERGNLLGLLNIAIGRRVTRADGTAVSTGTTWRALAGLLRNLRWDPQAVRELGLDPAALPPRDRQKFWYTAIAQANVGSPAASKEGDRVALLLAPLGYVVGPAPRTGGS
jgi:hypothetical protein